MGRYLVTGAAGFIGRSIAAALLARGETVRGIDNFITGKRANLLGLEAMEFVEGDLADPGVCAQACEGVEVICLSSGGAGFGAAVGGRPRGDECGLRGCNAESSGCGSRGRGAARGLCGIVFGLRRYADAAQARGDVAESDFAVRCGQASRRTLHAGVCAGVWAGDSGAAVLQCFWAVSGPTSHYSGVLAIFCRKMLAGEQPTIYGDGEQRAGLYVYRQCGAPWEFAGEKRRARGKGLRAE